MRSDPRVGFRDRHTNWLSIGGPLLGIGGTGVVALMVVALTVAQFKPTWPFGITMGGCVACALAGLYITIAPFADWPLPEPGPNTRRTWRLAMLLSFAVIGVALLWFLHGAWFQYVTATEAVVVGVFIIAVAVLLAFSNDKGDKEYSGLLGPAGELAAAREQRDAALQQRNAAQQQRDAAQQQRDDAQRELDAARRERDAARAVTPAVAREVDRLVVNRAPAELLRLCEGENTALETQRIVEPFIGKWVSVAGAVSNVREVADQYMVISEVNEGGVSAGVAYMFFDKTQKDRVEMLRRGDALTVMGRISELKYRDLTLRDCEIADK